MPTITSELLNSKFAAAHKLSASEPHPPSALYLSTESDTFEEERVAEEEVKDIAALISQLL